ncbi:MAG: hypothetical protein R2734_07430 [Nocardioides sp.]
MSDGQGGSTTPTRRPTPCAGSAPTASSRRSPAPAPPAAPATVASHRGPAQRPGPPRLLTPPGNLYIADSGNNKIRKVTMSTGVITTWPASARPATPATAARPRRRRSGLRTPYDVAFRAGRLDVHRRPGQPQGP